MPYKYEAHLHTSTSSACGRSQGPEYLQRYIELGYDGVFVTDHFYLGNTCVPRSLPWKEWVDHYCRAYYETKEAGDKLGIKVFFGWETTYGTGEDFLIYGLTPNWLKEHPEIITLSQEEQYHCIHEAGGLVVQAHPYRERGYMREIRLHPFHCDACEIANAGNLPYHDRNALRYAKNFGLTMTCGSDLHTVDAMGEEQLFAMVTEKPLNCEMDYVELIKSGSGFTTKFPEERVLCEQQYPGMPTYLYLKDGREVEIPNTEIAGDRKDFLL